MSLPAPLFTGEKVSETSAVEPPLQQSATCNGSVR
jgi:hypothetical protein